jgi:hypothetical protein
MTIETFGSLIKSCCHCEYSKSEWNHSKLSPSDSDPYLAPVPFRLKVSTLGETNPGFMAIWFDWNHDGLFHMEAFSGLKIR